MASKYITTLDLPSLHRVSLGFDRIFEELHRNFNNSVSNTYPPYNIIINDENTRTLEVAVAGFRENELNVEVRDGMLIVSGEHVEEKDELGNSKVQYQHRGISRRAFARTITLADHMEVSNATVENGILSVVIKLVVPEEEKPKKIPIAYKK